MKFLNIMGEWRKKIYIVHWQLTVEYKELEKKKNIGYSFMHS